MPDEFERTFDGIPIQETCGDPYLSRLGDEDFEWYTANRNIRQIPTTVLDIAGIQEINPGWASKIATDLNKAGLLDLCCLDTT
ncbi:hypothetical protein LINGRAHAP2_LOCUS19956, partial [Linum grandiflorum]